MLITTKATGRGRVTILNYEYNNDVETRILFMEMDFWKVTQMAGISRKF